MHKMAESDRPSSGVGVCKPNPTTPNFFAAMEQPSHVQSTRHGCTHQSSVLRRVLSAGKCVWQRSRNCGSVHVWTSNPNATIPFTDMGDLQYAALDPLVYAHHGNIDRLWEVVWKSFLGGGRKDLSQADFLNTLFLFYDENAALVKVQISQALNINNFRTPNTLITFSSSCSHLLLVKKTNS